MADFELQQIDSLLLTLQDVLRDKFALESEIEALPLNLSTQKEELAEANRKYLEHNEKYNKAKEEAAAKAKAKADHDAKILSKAKELGIPESRINEGFTLSDDATDEAIETYLSKVANNYKALQQPQVGGSYRAIEGEPTKEDVDNVAASLVQSL